MLSEGDAGEVRAELLCDGGVLDGRELACGVAREGFGEFESEQARGCEFTPELVVEWRRRGFERSDSLGGADLGRDVGGEIAHRRCGLGESEVHGGCSSVGG